MKNEALKLATAKFPTLQAFAEALSTKGRVVTYQTVQQWMSGSVPAKYCPDVERLAGYEVSRVDLRPKDGHHIWPEHVEQSSPNALRSDRAKTK